MEGDEKDTTEVVEGATPGAPKEVTREDANDRGGHEAIAGHGDTTSCMVATAAVSVQHQEDMHDEEDEHTGSRLGDSSWEQNRPDQLRMTDVLAVLPRVKLRALGAERQLHTAPAQPGGASAKATGEGQSKGGVGYERRSGHGDGDKSKDGTSAAKSGSGANSMGSSEQGGIAGSLAGKSQHSASSSETVGGRSTWVNAMSILHSLETDVVRATRTPKESVRRSGADGWSSSYGARSASSASDSDVSPHGRQGFLSRSFDVANGVWSRGRSHFGGKRHMRAVLPVVGSVSLGPRPGSVPRSKACTDHATRELAEQKPMASSAGKVMGSADREVDGVGSADAGSTGPPSPRGLSPQPRSAASEDALSSHGSAGEALPVDDRLVPVSSAVRSLIEHVAVSRSAPSSVSPMAYLELRRSGDVPAGGRSTTWDECDRTAEYAQRAIVLINDVRNETVCHEDYCLMLPAYVMRLSLFCLFCTMLLYCDVL